MKNFDTVRKPISNGNRPCDSRYVYYIGIILTTAPHPMRERVTR